MKGKNSAGKTGSGQGGTTSWLEWLRRHVEETLNSWVDSSDNPGSYNSGWKDGWSSMAKDAFSCKWDAGSRKWKVTIPGGREDGGPTAAGAKDMVNGPSHYHMHAEEEIDVIRNSMTAEEFNGYLKGNTKKYMDRCGGKDAAAQELNKAVWHAMFLYMVNGGTLEGLRRTVAYMEEKFK